MSTASTGGKRKSGPTPSTHTTKRTRGGHGASGTAAPVALLLAQHPGSTAGDVAKALNLNPGSASTRLTQLAKAGEIKKASRGYTTK